jgi:hypothetical protein
VARDGAPRYEPPDAFAAPRFTGVRTFGRCPVADGPEGVGVAVLRPAQPTAVAAANVAFELLTLDVLGHAA